MGSTATVAGAHTQGGGGVLGNRISCSNPPRAKFKKGGVLGGGVKGVFRCAGVLSAGRAPHPPPMKYIVSGTSEQLGMRPKCDPTICTAPTNVYGRVSLAWVFPAGGTRNLGTVGLQGGHGVRNTPWGYKGSMGVETHQGRSWGSECIMGLEINHGMRNASGGGHKRGGGCDYTDRATREALRAMADQASLPAPLCGPSSPSVHATTREGEGERGGVGGGGGIRFWRVCACSSAYFFRPDVFTVQHFLALCLVVVMGHFVPLPGTAFFRGELLARKKR